MVLGPLVRELAFRVGRINLPPEDIEKLVIGDHVRVVRNLYRFQVPRQPDETSSYVGFALAPPAYPETTSVTPLRFRNGGCMHQKQPPANVAFFSCMISLRFVSPCFNQLHRFAMADQFASAGFLHKNDVPADITSVYFTGFLDVYHTFSSLLAVSGRVSGSGA